MDTLRTKHFPRGKYLSCIPKHTTQDEYSHLCLPPGLQSLDSAQMSN